MTGPARRAMPTMARVDFASLDPVVMAAAVIAGLGGAIADGAPTGLFWWDPMLRVAFAAALPVAGALASRRSLLMASALATVVAGLTIWLAFAVAGFALAGWMWRHRRDAQLGALAGAAVALSLLHATVSPFFGASALVAAVASIPVFADGYRNARRRPRRAARRVAGVVTTIVALAVLTSLVAVLVGRLGAQRGLAASRRGLVAAQAGEVDDARNEFTVAEQSLSDAAGAFGAWWSLPGRLVPVVSQHLRAADVAAAQGVGLSSAAGLMIEEAPFRELRASSGRIDLSPVVQMQSLLETTTAQLADAQVAIADVDSRWLVPSLRRSLADLGAELSDAATQTDLAAHAVQVLPRMLGNEGIRRYFAVVTNPAETRELGGFVGAYAVIEVSDGQLRLVESGDNNQLIDRTRSTGVALADPSGYPEWYTTLSKIEEFPQNLTASPSPEIVASAAIELFPEIAGGSIDGVLMLDPYAIEALIGLVGGIEIVRGDGADVFLDATNTADFLLREQYLQFDDNAERNDLLVDAMTASVDALLSMELPGPERLGAIFGPLARGGRLQLVTTDDAANGFLRRVFLLRPFPQPTDADFISVVQTNGAANKLDAWLERSIDHAVRYDPATGDTRSTVTVTLSSNASAELPLQVRGRPGRATEPGQMRIQLSLYSALRASAVAIDGTGAPRATVDELGYERNQVSVIVNPGETVTVTFELIGRTPTGGYELVVANQPIAADDDYSISVTPSQGWQLGSGPDGVASVSFPLVEDTLLSWPATER